jgi:hypothetical protein
MSAASMMPVFVTKFSMPRPYAVVPFDFRLVTARSPSPNSLK